MDNSEPHPLDPDSRLNPAERLMFQALHAHPTWTGREYWTIAAEASMLVTCLRTVGATVDTVDPLPDAARARHGDPKTSEIAAASIHNMTERHRAVLQIAQTFADVFTYDELIHRYNNRRENGYSYGKRTPSFVLDLPAMEPSSIRSRCKALARGGWIEEAGRGLSDAGRPCNTWRVIR